MFILSIKKSILQVLKIGMNPNLPMNILSSWKHIIQHVKYQLIKHLLVFLKL